MRSVGRSIWLAAGLSVLAACATPSQASTVNIISNGGFESGSLSPWSETSGSGNPGTNWTVETSVVHSGIYAAMDAGNKSLQENFTAVATSSISSISFWIDQPHDPGYGVQISYLYSDGTSSSFVTLGLSTAAGWQQVNLLPTHPLASGKNLVGFSLFGYAVSASQAPLDVTYIDDVDIEATPPSGGNTVPIPAAAPWVLLVSAAGAIWWRRRRLA